MKTPRLGFLGAGWIGRKRLDSVAESGLAEIVAVADPIAANAYATKDTLPDIKVVGGLDDLLALRLDGVVIATPSALHALQSVAALRGGAAVFCQKPLARTGSEVREIIDTARTADRLLDIDLSYRYTQGLRAIHDLFTQGALGDIFAAEFVFHNSYGPDKPWFYDARLSGGGCVMDLGVHLVDAAFWILGAEPQSVSSRLLRNGRPLISGDSQVEDFATASITLQNGCVIQLSCSWRLHAGTPAVIEATFHGTQGGAAFRNVNGSFLDFTAHHLVGTESRLLAEPPEDWGRGAILNWVARLAQGNRYDASIEQHQKVADTLDAIYGRSSPVRSGTGTGIRA